LANKPDVLVAFLDVCCLTSCIRTPKGGWDSNPRGLDVRNCSKSVCATDGGSGGIMRVMPALQAEGL